MRLNHPGIYRVIGENYELLANIIGEAPCFRITGALSMNHLVKDGEFQVLTEESIEIQQIYNNPDAFIFLEYEYSEICELPPYRKSIRGTKIPDITDTQMEEFQQRYAADMRVTGRGILATKAYILSKTNWSLAQVNALIMQIAKRHKLNLYGHSLTNQ